MEETKKCPYCGGEILAVAKKCKHCGKWLNEDPAPTPATETQPIKETQPINNEPAKPKKSKNIIIGVLGAVIVVLVGILVAVLLGGKEKYYLLGRQIWQPTSDYHNWIAVISDTEEDTFARGKAWQGNLGIGSKRLGEKIKPILMSSEVNNSVQFKELTGFTAKEAFGEITFCEPCSKEGLANIVFFNFIPMYGYGSEDFSIYGRVDINTKKFELLPGDFVGLIRVNKYKDCFVCKRDEMIYVFPQSTLNEKVTSVLGFKWEDYFKNYPTNEELIYLIGNQD